MFKSALLGAALAVTLIAYAPVSADAAKKPKPCVVNEQGVRHQIAIAKGRVGCKRAQQVGRRWIRDVAKFPSCETASCHIKYGQWWCSSETTERGASCQTQKTTFSVRRAPATASTTSARHRKRCGRLKIDDDLKYIVVHRGSLTCKRARMTIQFAFNVFAGADPYNEPACDDSECVVTYKSEWECRQFVGDPVDFEMYCSRGRSAVAALYR